VARAREVGQGWLRLRALFPMVADVVGYVDDVFERGLWVQWCTLPMPSRCSHPFAEPGVGLCIHVFLCITGAFCALSIRGGGGAVCWWVSVPLPFAVATLCVVPCLGLPCGLPPGRLVVFVPIVCTLT
jgi:hypothetical protein